jgi:hypothetical protein
MNAEDFYRLNKFGKRMENEYFIAMDKKSLFRMMEAYAKMKCDQKTNIEPGVKQHKLKYFDVL